MKHGTPWLGTRESIPQIHRFDPAEQAVDLDCPLPIQQNWGYHPSEPVLRVYLDVGRNDSLAPGVEVFAAASETHDLKPAFHLYNGEHDRTYWRAHTAEYLAFYAASW